MPFSDRLAVVFGGSGFLGRYVVRALANRGWRVRVATRRPGLAFHLQPLGNVGQIGAVQANLRYPASVAAAADGADFVVNLVGILKETGRQGFPALHTMGAGYVAEAARRSAARLVHVSAIGADAQAPSEYGRTKAAGEEAVGNAVRDAVIFRPSILFGPEDDFFNRFAAMARLSPVLPLIGGGGTRFQPAFVGDVAEAIARAAEGRAKPAIYELGGPEILTFRQCLERMMQETQHSRLFLNLPFPVARALGRLTGWLPGAPLTYDQVRSLEVDNVVAAEAVAEGRTFAGLGIQPTPLAAILPQYLQRFRPHGQFSHKGEI
jgi:NADH dehydrogenase